MSIYIYSSDHRYGVGRQDADDRNQFYKVRDKGIVTPYTFHSKIDLGDRKHKDSHNPIDYWYPIDQVGNQTNHY